MKRICSAGVVWAYGITAFSLFLLGLAADCGAQMQKAAPAAPAFEVVSFRYAGRGWDHMSAKNGRNSMTWRPVEYKGIRLSGDAPIGSIIEFACSPLLKPYRQEELDWMRGEYYQIEAIAPAGTTLDGARAMLRRALAERLGFQYHLADRETPVYFLVRGSGSLKLKPSTGPEPKSGPSQMWVYKVKSAKLASFARFLTSVVGRDVIDKSGIQGNYEFNEDWSKEVVDAMSAGGVDPGIALAGVKRLGLKLEPGKEMRRVLVVDRANKRPTAN